MSSTRILWGRIVAVLSIILLTVGSATRWTAWRLGYQEQLGQPWFEFFGVPFYPPQAFFWWRYFYDAYAPRIFYEAPSDPCSGAPDPVSADQRLASPSLVVNVQANWPRNLVCLFESMACDSAPIRNF